MHPPHFPPNCPNPISYSLLLFSLQERREFFYNRDFVLAQEKVIISSSKQAANVAFPFSFGDPDSIMCQQECAVAVFEGTPPHELFYPFDDNLLLYYWIVFAMHKIYFNFTRLIFPFYIFPAFIPEIYTVRAKCCFSKSAN